MGRIEETSNKSLNSYCCYTIIVEMSGKKGINIGLPPLIFVFINLKKNNQKSILFIF